MVVVVVRIVATILVMLGVALPAGGQPTSPGPLQAPSLHAATGLKFPPRIDGHARLVRSVDRGKSEGRPDLGYIWTYIVEPPIDGTASVYVYNAGETSIPAGAASPQVFTQFHAALAEIGQQFPNIDALKTVKGPTDCTIARVVFRCATLLAITPTTKVPVHTTVLVTAYRNYFVTVWLEWSGTQATPAAAEDYLGTLIGEMTR